VLTNACSLQSATGPFILDFKHIHWPNLLSVSYGGLLCSTYFTCLLSKISVRNPAGLLHYTKDSRLVVKMSSCILPIQNKSGYTPSQLPVEVYTFWEGLSKTDFRKSSTVPGFGGIGR
jgi:hypothetical protein